MGETTRYKARGVALLGVCVLLVLCGLQFVLRTPSLDFGAGSIWHAGNPLESHNASDYPKSDFANHFAKLQLALLMLGVVWVVRQGKRYILVPLVLGVPALVHTVWSYTSTSFRGLRYFGLCDDAFISMRYARMLSAGEGLVYNPGEKVEGYSNPLWTLLMALPHMLGIPERHTAACVMVLGFCLLIFASWVAVMFVHRAGGSTASLVFVGLAMFADRGLFEFTLVGLEPPLLAFLGVSAFVAMEWRRYPIAAIALSLLPLVRADATLAALLLMSLYVWPPSGQHLWTHLTLLRAPCLGVIVGASANLLWHLVLYGDWAPNTYHLKVYAFSDRIVTGIASHGVRGIAMYGFAAAIVVFVAGSERSMRQLRLLAPFLGLWLYGMYVGGDAFPGLRFVSAALPLFWIAVGQSVHTLLQRHQLAPAWQALFAFAVPVYHVDGVLVGGQPGFPGWLHSNLVSASALKENVPAGTEIGIFYAGTIPYFTPTMRYIDVLGKTDPHISHIKKIPTSVPGHNKYDFDYVYLRRKPKLTFAAASCEDVSTFIAQHPLPPVPGRYEYFGWKAQLLNQAFRSNYLPHPVQFVEDSQVSVPTPTCIYRRSDSGLHQTWNVLTRK